MQALFPWQEAAADLYSHPWHPDLWAICNILAQREGGEPEDISDKARGTASLLPHFSAAEMLWTPILARGAGLQLKRTPHAVLLDSTVPFYNRRFGFRFAGGVALATQPAQLSNSILLEETSSVMVPKQSRAHCTAWLIADGRHKL